MWRRLARSRRSLQLRRRASSSSSYPSPSQTSAGGDLSPQSPVPFVLFVSGFAGLAYSYRQAIWDRLPQEIRDQLDSVRPSTAGNEPKSSRATFNENTAPKKPVRSSPKPSKAPSPPKPSTTQKHAPPPAPSVAAPVSSEAVIPTAPQPAVTPEAAPASPGEVPAAPHLIESPPISAGNVHNTCTVENVSDADIKAVAAARDVVHQLEARLVDAYRDVQSADARARAARREEMHKIAHTLHQEYARDQETRLGQLEQLGRQFATLATLTDWLNEHDEATERTRRWDRALDDFESEASSSARFGVVWSKIRALASDDLVHRAAVQAVDRAKINTTGAMTRSELQKRFFSSVERPLREVAMLPAADAAGGAYGLLPRLVARVASSLLVSEPVHNPAAGDDAAVSRVAFHVQHGDLDAALEELGSLESPKARLLAADWEKETSQRLLLDSVHALLKARYSERLLTQ